MRTYVRIGGLFALLALLITGCGNERLSSGVSKIAISEAVRHSPISDEKVAGGLRTEAAALNDALLRDVPRTDLRRPDLRASAFAEIDRRIQESFTEWKAVRSSTGRDSIPSAETNGRSDPDSVTVPQISVTHFEDPLPVQKAYAAERLNAYLQVLYLEGKVKTSGLDRKAHDTSLQQARNELSRIDSTMDSELSKLGGKPETSIVEPPADEKPSQGGDKTPSGERHTNDVRDDVVFVTPPSSAKSGVRDAVVSLLSNSKTRIFIDTAEYKAGVRDTNNAVSRALQALGTNRDGVSGNTRDEFGMTSEAVGR